MILELFQIIVSWKNLHKNEQNNIIILSNIKNLVKWIQSIQSPLFQFYIYYKKYDITNHIILMARIWSYDANDKQE